LQFFNVGIDELDHLTRIDINQMIVVFAIRGFIARAAIAKLVLFQNSGFF